jgi:serine O-acetyltransferase
MMTHADSAPALTLETLWVTLRTEADLLQKMEPVLGPFLQNGILWENTFSGALCRVLACKLASTEVSIVAVHDIFTKAHLAAPELAEAAKHDLLSVMEHDPAAYNLLTPFLFFKGFHALQSYRVAHWLWQKKRMHLALYFQNRMSDLFGVDIHPAAVIGHGVMLDHATGIVIGETAVVEDDVLFWHGVTLGGKVMTPGDRHPKIRRGAQLGAGSTILGSIEVGAGACVAAGSVVIDNVPAGATVAGVPARIVQ